MGRVGLRVLASLRYLLGLRKASRAFVSTDVPVGCLICHRCCRRSYRSQDAPRRHRLAEQIDTIRIRLGGSPVLGRTNEPVPPKPPRMHWRRYDRLTGELGELEAALRELEEVRKHIVEQQLDAAHRRALRKLAPAYEQLARLEERAQRSW